MELSTIEPSNFNYLLPLSYAVKSFLLSISFTAILHFTLTPKPTPHLTQINLSFQFLYGNETPPLSQTNLQRKSTTLDRLI